MAETLTIDPTPPAEIAGEQEGVSLTAEEQDSLAVGEKIQGEQETLLAGKYKSAEELEKAYGELEKKLGESGQQEETTDSTETTESQDEPKSYLEDGTVNYESVNEAYGETLGNIFKEGNVDPWSISEHFHTNNGTITDDMYKSLEDAGLSRASIDSYLAGRSTQMGYETAAEEPEVTQSDIDSIQSSIGGSDEYGKLVDWAGSNLDQKSIDSFDNLLSTGNVQMIKLAVLGIKAKYDEANGYEGRMLQGKAPQTSGNVFRSQAELVQAMSDSRYENDPAYRQDVIEKLDRSDMQF